MYRKHQNIISFICLFLFSSLLAGGIGCDSILPDEFKEKDYSSPTIDVTASNILARDTTGYSTNPNNFYIVNARTMLSMVDNITQVKLTQDSITENQVILSKFDALADSLNATPLIRDTEMFIQIDNSSSTAYSVLNISAGQSKDIYLYTSLIYTSTNINEYLSVQLIKRDTSLLSYSNDMLMETVSSGTTSIVDAGQSRLVPIIKGRYRIHVEEGVYLVRFIKSSILGFGGLAKILILSI